ncbi:MAG: hypothetical protein BWX63_02317 [Bacteroidetes bacterium ADurb.Bin041]|nr:MAG: hypothetical protein BWX63_02317 [Bacteroidetes bacterium ADurb.Bin041]
MNFKKYYVSKNLFDDFDIVGQVPSVSNGNLVNSVSGATTSFIKMGSAEIVLSYNAIANIYLFLYGNDSQFIGYTQKTNGESVYSTSISGYSDAAYCRVRVDNLPAFSNANLMLNLGSQPLPYEPYSSEVLHDTPHYIHNTSTDTITTLPAVLYPNDTTVTVGLKGNMSQTGTPTPDNPIQPQECGDLETEGTKAGQYKIPISSANTTTPVYLGEVETTRRIEKLVLTGEENWKKSSAYAGSFYAAIITRLISEGYSAYCSHLTFTILSQYTKGKFCFNGDVTYKNCNLWFNQFDSSTTVEDFKSYLAAQYVAGTPVTVWYILATETTGIVNEPLRKIGDYADEVSGITIPTIAGANTLSVDTTLQPSEVSVNYKGWHPVADVHERDSGAWT